MSEEMPPNESVNEEQQPEEAMSEEMGSQEPKVEETSTPETPLPEMPAPEQPVLKESPDKNKRVLITVIVIESIIILGLLLIIFIMGFAIIHESETAKLSSIKANFSLAYTTVALNSFEGMSAREAAKEVIYDLNTENTPDNTSDDIPNIYDPSLSAFGSKPGPGVVVIEAADAKIIVITAYDKDQKPIESKKVNISDDEQGSGTNEESVTNSEETTQDMDSNEEEQFEDPYEDKQDREDREYE